MPDRSPSELPNIPTADSVVADPMVVSQKRPLRMWPAVLIVVGMLVATQVIPRLYMRTVLQFLCLVTGAPIGALLLLIWWFRFSHVEGRDRWLFPLLYLGGGLVLFVAFYMGPPAPFLMVLGLPSAAIGWVGSLVLCSARLADWRRGAVATAIVAAWAIFALIRVDGTDGDMNPQISWRFRPTAEQQLLNDSQNRKDAAALAASASPTGQELTLQPGDWPAFRGPLRDSRNLTDEIDPDWTNRPPREIWRRRIGPGWGSCCLVSGRLYTQEQRGENEDLVCYDAASGAEIWRNSTPTRFVEGISGAGPRATPTFHSGRIYSYGATGRLSCCDAATGKVDWSIDARETGAQVPTWGIACSPLVGDGLVFVYLGATPNRGTGAFAAETGKLVWASGVAAHGYSSAQFAELHGVRQVLMLSDHGIEAFLPANGMLLWEFAWVDPGINRDVQPIVDGSDVLISTGIGNNMGWKRLRVEQIDGRFSAKELWTSRTLRPYYNDCVVHEGHAYGFDQNIFTCVRLSDGVRAWRQGRYGSGQVVLLARQGLLIVQAETGEVVLLAADPTRHRELGRIPALSQKTWNHPVVAQGNLYVRNGEEIACFALAPTADSR